MRLGGITFPCVKEMSAEHCMLSITFSGFQVKEANVEYYVSPSAR